VTDKWNYVKLNFVLCRTWLLLLFLGRLSSAYRLLPTRIKFLIFSLREENHVPSLLVLARFTHGSHEQHLHQSSPSLRDLELLLDAHERNYSPLPQMRVEEDSNSNHLAYCSDPYVGTILSWFPPLFPFLG
jgi:hypothetical protein